MQMLILIAESKTMSPCRGEVNAADFAARHPIYEERAHSIMTELRELDAAELTGATRLSTVMALRLRSMALSFADKSTGSDAVEAFTGVVFKAFSYPTLPSEAKGRARGCIRIISSLYGWLRPDDIIKPYRLDFGMHLPVDSGTLASYWRDAVTDALLGYLKENACSSILDLLPADAARCIDWRRVASVAKVYKADFREIQSGEKVRTPHAGRLKVLRGQLLRQIMTENIMAPEQLEHLSSEDYMAGAADDNGNIIFHTAR